MQNKPKIIDYAIRNFIINDFEETMINSIMAVFNVDRIDAEYKTEKNLSSLWRLFVERVEEHTKTNMNPYVTITDRTTMRFEDFCRIKGNEKRIEKIRKAKLSRRLIIYEYLEGLNWREYEALGCVVMEFLGADEDRIHLTASGNEEGVDFLSIVPAYGKHHLIPNFSKKLRIIGQSKKWINTVPKERIALLNDAIDNFKRRRIEFVQKFPGWIFDNDCVYQGIVFSHSRYQSGAKEFARDYGIILANTFDAAEVISLSFGVVYNVEEIIDRVGKRISLMLA